MLNFKNFCIMHGVHAGTNLCLFFMYLARGATASLLMHQWCTLEWRGVTCPRF